MPQQRTAYRPTPTSPTTPVAPQPTSSAIEDLDDFLEEVDAILDQEQEFAVQYRQRGGQ